MYKNLSLIALVFILGIINWSIAGKEKQLAEGKIVYLDLTPVDPRSIMQGDYMALRFRLANEVYDHLIQADAKQPWIRNMNASDGFVVAGLDERNIGTFKRLNNIQPLANNEVLMRYRVRNGVVNFATNAYFFQEGHAQDYQAARYGQFRVDDKGELLLAALYDQNLKKLEHKPVLH